MKVFGLAIIKFFFQFVGFLAILLIFRSILAVFLIAKRDVERLRSFRITSGYSFVEIKHFLRYMTKKLRKVFNGSNFFVKLLSNKVCGSFIGPVGFYAIFHLIDISSDPLYFSSTKTGSTGSAQGALRFLRAFELTSFKVCDSQKMFLRLIFMV